MKHISNNFKAFYGLVFLILWSCPKIGNAQDFESQMDSNDSIVSSSWIVGLGLNIVDDSGRNPIIPASISEEWNIFSFPSRISVGHYFANGLGVEVIGSANMYKAGKTVDSKILGKDEPYWAVDSRITYDLNKVFGETGKFDPYAGAGFGYTHASGLTRATLNALIGFRYWFSQTWGLDVNGTGKWYANNDATNHTQYAAGVVFRTSSKQRLSEKGQEKLDKLRREWEEEQQRQEAKRKAEEEAALKAKREREAREAEEAARRANQKPDLNMLQTQLNSKGSIYFEVNKSVLNTNNKAVLASIAEFMNANSELKFELHAHADSRGTEAYNQMLTEQRAKSVNDYLGSLGIDQSRLTTFGHGESQLLNKCKDHVRCSEADHAVNRRCEVKIIGL